MKRYLAFGGLALLAVFLVLRDPVPAPAPGSTPRAVTTPETQPPQRWGSAGEFPARNPFEYGGPTTAATPVVEEPGAGVSPSSAPGSTAPAGDDARVPGVRLVGLVRLQGELKAALAIGDELVVLGPGEGWAGHQVVEVDEDRGVRLRSEAGEITLAFQQ